MIQLSSGELATGLVFACGARVWSALLIATAIPIFEIGRPQWRGVGKAQSQ